MNRKTLPVCALCMSLGVAAASAEEISVVIKNMQQADGMLITPVVVASHNGSFDTFDPASPAPEYLERIAEDGNVMPLMAAARQSGHVSEVKASEGGPIAPGESRVITFEVSANDPMTQYLSLAAMVIPSNDAFIGNGNPQMIPLFDKSGQFISRSGANAMMIRGESVWDAGTEVNDEIPEHTPLLGQMEPNTGVTENGMVRPHIGFMGSLRTGDSVGNVLAAFPDADFSHPGTLVARVSVLPGSTIACDDVVLFAAKADCEKDKIKIRVEVADGHEGETVLLDVNGGQVAATVSGRVARATLRHVDGVYHIGLAGPVDCQEPVTVVCP